MEQNTPVIVRMPGMVIRGKVVGKATNNISESYIIKCVDGQLPNAVYTYDTFVAQLIDIDK